jgi:four helix bundle protein
VFRATEFFPRREHFGLAAQIRKTAISIASNIAEGHNRSSRLAYRNHVAIALGSQAELETQVELAGRLEFVSEQAANALLATIGEVGRMLHGLLSALNRDASTAERQLPSP